MKKKKFDAIKMTREIREKLSKEFMKDPEGFLQKLEEKHPQKSFRKTKPKQKSKA